MLRRTTLVTLAIVAIVALAAVPSSTASPGIGNVPQGTQTDKAYAKSGAYRVTNVLATTQRTSCYMPEVPFFTSLAPVNAYDGMTVCTGANTGEDPGPYPTQAGSNPGYPAANPMLVIRNVRPRSRCTSISRPARNSRNASPIRARISTGSSIWTQPRPEGPIAIPATISSTTAGSRSRGASPRANGAANATTTTIRRFVKCVWAMPW